MNKVIHYIGLDVHKESIAVSIAPQHSTEVRRYGIIGGTLDAVDKLVKKLAQPNVELRFVYEAGPCGFVLCRHLRSQGLVCDVVAPSLIPKKASDRVKTDRRDADQLARLFRAGELTAIHVPDQEDEAIRDLVRARTSAMMDQRKARNRLKGFLLRLGFRYTGKSSWNDAHKRYLSGLVMPQPPQQIAFQEYIHAINDATDRLERLTQAVEDALAGLEVGAGGEGADEPARRAGADGDDAGGGGGGFQPVRRRAFANALFRADAQRTQQRRTRVQGGITRCGNAALPAGAYRGGVALPVETQGERGDSETAGRPKQGGAAHCLESTERLHKRFKQLSARKKSVVAATAVARELAAFVWAIACRSNPPNNPPPRKSFAPAAARFTGWTRRRNFGKDQIAFKKSKADANASAKHRQPSSAGSNR